ncbi:MAG: UDP-N-acetylmuramoyl-L-alanyl-D-glutamate--2,6-diaminopimelate ligase [Myxococcota bacterium]
MKLHDVLQSAGVPNQVTGPRDVSLTDLVCDSRAVTPGSAFVAIRGFHVDGHDYIAPAMSQGASAIFAETMPPADLEEHVAWVRVTSTDDALGHLAAAFHGHPSERIEVMAVTGTNGKTTVSWLVEAILKHAGHRTGLVGTIETHIGEQVEPAVFTTPFGDEMQRLLGRMRDAECSHAILEASSHGLKQDRVAGVRIAAAGFTNLSRDHLDFHLTMDDYQASKKRLFSHYALAAAINIDDPVGAAFADDFDGPLLRLSVEGDTSADVIVTELTCELDGCRAVVETPDGVVNLNLDLVGKHNVENALVALGMCRLVGVPFAVGAKALSSGARVPGRLERVDGPRAVLVDYAHTPDALINVLQGLRPMVSGRLICVFGAGGNRDAGKRAHMGAAVERYADLPVVTSDNPRTEVPEAIVEAILSGMAPEGQRIVEVDRRMAIEQAIYIATPDDLVLIAGKGHETYQVIGTTKYEFDDRTVAKGAMSQLAQGTATLAGGAA